jgi:hypothetical protein
MTREETPARRPGARPAWRSRVEGNQGLSGSYYVVGELDVSRPGADVPPIERSAIRIRTPSRCDHTETVCSDCAERWMYDWTFRFSRTAGGRRLLGETALAEMARRRAVLEARPAGDAATPARPAGRVIEVDGAVFDLLTSVKRGGETYSDAIRRMLSAPPAGGQGGTGEGAEK